MSPNIFINSNSKKRRDICPTKIFPPPRVEAEPEIFSILILINPRSTYSVFCLLFFDENSHLDLCEYFPVI